MRDGLKFVVQKVGRGHPNSGSWLVAARYDSGHLSTVVPVQAFLGSEERAARAMAERLNRAFREGRNAAA